MTKLENLKEQIKNYDWMTHSEYKNLKQEILALDDASISNIYSTVIDSIEENENEVRWGLLESEQDLVAYNKRTKYFFKLNSAVGKYVFALWDLEAEKPIEQKLKESTTELLINYLETLENYEGSMMTPDVVENHIYICKGILFARGV
tara:strand:+ start:320 stop:763 length:444 start_codon:yes stop_codon:yes gene_type:complete